MSVKHIEAIGAILVVLTCIIGGIILIAKGIDGKVGAALLVIACGYLGIDLALFKKLGRNTAVNKGATSKRKI